MCDARFWRRTGVRAPQGSRVVSVRVLTCQREQTRTAAVSEPKREYKYRVSPAAADACDRWRPLGGKKRIFAMRRHVWVGSGWLPPSRGGLSCAMKMRRVPETHKGPAPPMRGLFLSPRGVVTTGVRVCVS